MTMFGTYARCQRYSCVIYTNTHALVRTRVRVSLYVIHYYVILYVICALYVLNRTKYQRIE